MTMQEAEIFIKEKDLHISIKTTESQDCTVVRHRFGPTSTSTMALSSQNFAHVHFEGILR